MEPKDAKTRRAIKPVICYSDDTLPKPDLALYKTARAEAKLIDEILTPRVTPAALTSPKGIFSEFPALKARKSET